MYYLSPVLYVPAYDFCSYIFCHILYYIFTLPGNSLSSVSAWLLSAFLRNDSAPGLATKAVIIGSIFNIFGDYFFVFTLDMGITGAGLATSVGSVISLLIMCTHFLSKKCMLRLVAPKQVLSSWKAIAPFIIRSYATSFPFLLLNVYSTYYFPSILKPGLSFIISIARGLDISGSLILLLPRIAPASSLWFAMTITETLVAVFVIWQMLKTDRELR